jgi:hypothetical protein
MNDGAEERAKELTEGVRWAIEPNASYLSYGEDDEVRYFAPEAALDALAWLLTDAVLPFLIGIGSSAAFERFRTHQTAPIELTDGQVAVLRRETVEALISTRPAGPKAGPEEARIAAREILRERGWPEDEAIEDAERLVRALDERLNER